MGRGRPEATQTHRLSLLLCERVMIDLKYSLVIEATTDPTFFGFYSPELEGFTGVGHSFEDCLHKAKRGMEEHLRLLREHRLPIPCANPTPTVVLYS